MSAPVGFQLQQRQLTDPDGTLVWLEPERRPLFAGTPEGDLEALWKRRANANRVRIPGGVEFDAYGPGCAPCPELARARVRITWLDADGRLIGGAR